MPTRRYRRKPFEIDAVQWFNHGDHPSVIKMPDPDGTFATQGRIVVRGGEFTINPGDWIVGGPGQEHPVSPNVFEAMYELKPGP